jgi:hypothetical protein
VKILFYIFFFFFFYTKRCYREALNIEQAKKQQGSNSLEGVDQLSEAGGYKKEDEKAGGKVGGKKKEASGKSTKVEKGKTEVDEKVERAKTPSKKGKKGVVVSDTQGVLNLFFLFIFFMFLF